MTNLPKTCLTMLLRQKSVLFGSIAVFATFSMIAFKYVPKRFKVQTIVGVQTQYFQNPLVRDFLPETFDGSELRAQREALIRSSLSYEFLKDLGQRYELFGKKNTNELTSSDLEGLLREFEVVPTGSTSFLIGFFHSNPETGYQVIREVITHVRETLAAERRTTMLRLRGAIQERLEALAFGQQSGVGPIVASRPDLVKEEVERIQEEIKLLKTQYSDRHPKVAELTKKLSDLGKWLKPSAEVTRGNPRLTSFSKAKVDETSKDLFQDLLKKYHYLEIAIYLDEQSQDSYMTVLQQPYVPKAPLWPKRPIFLIWGVATGFFVGTLLVLAIELIAERRRRVISLRAAVVN